jgi:ABC-2 type transport system ATP-binding protein
VTRVVRALDEAGVDVEDVAVHQPSLDDVFMRLTGAGPHAPGLTSGGRRARQPELEEVTG